MSSWLARSGPPTAASRPGRPFAGRASPHASARRIGTTVAGRPVTVLTSTAERSSAGALLGFVLLAVVGRRAGDAAFGADVVEARLDDVRRDADV